MAKSYIRKVSSIHDEQCDCIYFDTGKGESKKNTGQYILVYSPKNSS